MDSAGIGSPRSGKRSRAHEPRPARRYCRCDDRASAQSGPDGNDRGYRRANRPLVTCESQGSGDRGSGPGAARVSPTAASWAEEARPMTVSWVTPIASGSSRAGIAGIWAGPETEVTGRPRSSVLLLCRPLRGVEGRAPFPRLPPGTAVRDRSQTAGGLAGWGLRGPARWPSPGRLGRPSGCTPLRGTSGAHAFLHFAHPRAVSGFTGLAPFAGRGSALVPRRLARDPRGAAAPARGARPARSAPR